jgi:hypothetical protein
MQKNGAASGFSAGPAFDTGTQRFYPYEHDSPHFRLHHVLLLPGAGVWVGNQRDSFQPTR